jgi:hypothetical protein
MNLIQNSRQATWTAYYNQHALRALSPAETGAATRFIPHRRIFWNRSACSDIPRQPEIHTCRRSCRLHSADCGALGLERPLGEIFKGQVAPNKSEYVPSVAWVILHSK